MSQSVHWAKNRKTWVIVFGAFFILIGVVGAVLGDGSYYWAYVLIGLTWLWEPVCERLKAPKWTEWTIVAIAACAVVYALYSMFHHHRCRGRPKTASQAGARFPAARDWPRCLAASS